MACLQPKDSRLHKHTKKSERKQRETKCPENTLTCMKSAAVLNTLSSDLILYFGWASLLTNYYSCCYFGYVKSQPSFDYV